MSHASVRARYALLVCVLVLASLPLAGQQTVGTVRGTISDQTGAVVPGVTVELINVGTSIGVSSQTNETGSYIFNAVLPGDYKLKVAFTGFKTIETEAFPVEVGRNVRRDYTLETGALSESVSVEANALTVETTSASVSTYVSTKLMQDLPNLSRFGLDPVNMAPGVSMDFGGNAGQMIGIEGPYAYVNSNRRGQNSWYLDGGENAGAWRNGGMQFPNPDALREVQVQTSNASAEYGKQPGAVIQAVAKSGTNELHGTAFLFTHHEALNANSFNNNAQNKARPEDSQRNWGGVFGGPIVKNKTFYFLSFNRYTNSSAGSNLVRLPTAKMVAGDFSEVPDFVDSRGNATPFNIKDPETGASYGKKLPANAVSPIAAQLAKLFPTVDTYYAQALRTYIRPAWNNEYLAKVDHNINTNHQLAATYMFTRGRRDDPGHSWANNQLDEWGSYREDSTIHNGSIRHFWMVDPTKTVETRYSMNDSHSPRNSTAYGRDITDFGAKMPWQYPTKAFPGLNISGLAVGTAATPDVIDQSNWRINSKMSWLKGSHNIRFGGETQMDRNPIYNYETARSSYSFSGLFSLNGPRQFGVQYPSPGNYGSQSIAYAWADFLMGRVASFSMDGLNGNDVKYRTHNFFFQDEWKATRRLSLELGLRYELYGEISEIDNKIGGFFVWNHQSDQFPTAPLHMAFAGDKGVPRGIIKQDRNNFAPRFGFAYDPFGKGKTVIRGAFGVFYSGPSIAVLRQFVGTGYGGGASGSNALLSDPIGTSKINPWDTAPQYSASNPPTNPLVGYTPATFPWANRYATQTINGVPNTRFYNSSFRGIDPNVTTPYSLQYNLTLEREITSGILVSAGYVANRNIHLTAWQDINYSEWRAGANTSSQSLRDRRIWPTLSDVKLFQSRLRGAWDSLQLVAKFRQFHGLTAEISHVYGKNISPWFNSTGDVIFDTSGNATYPAAINLDKALNGNKHTFKAYFAYDVPFLRRGDSLLNKIAGGWTVSGAMTARDGNPMTVSWGYDANADGFGSDRPSMIAPIQYAGGTADERSAMFLSKASFSSPCGIGAPLNTNCNVYGDAGRNIIFGTARWNLDMGLLKSFRVREGHNLQVRAESSNLFNTNFVGDPDLGLGQGSNPNFGKVFSRSHNARRVQLGVKYIF